MSGPGFAFKWNAVNPDVDWQLTQSKSYGDGIQTLNGAMNALLGLRLVFFFALFFAVAFLDVAFLDVAFFAVAFFFVAFFFRVAIDSS